MRTLLLILVVFLVAPWVRATVTPSRPLLRFWPNGKPKERTMSRLDVNGRWVEEGPYQSWYASGRPELEGMNRNGKPSGQWRGWYETGEPFVECQYEDGVGEFVWRYPTGQVLRRGYRDENDVSVGRWTEWYPSGRKRWEGEFLEGERHGAWTHWTDETPPRVAREVWRHGQRVP
jgi:antitoxin component YwqK of YwqJK toxin-antitoxin module